MYCGVMMVTDLKAGRQALGKQKGKTNMLKLRLNFRDQMYVLKFQPVALLKIGQVTSDYALVLSERVTKKLPQQMMKQNVKSI